MCCYVLIYTSVVVLFFFLADQMSELEERLDHLRVSAPHRTREQDSETEDTGSYGDRHSPATEEFPSAFEAYIKGMVRTVVSCYPMII